MQVITQAPASERVTLGQASQVSAVGGLFWISCHLMLEAQSVVEPSKSIHLDQSLLYLPVEPCPDYVVNGRFQSTY